MRELDATGGAVLASERPIGEQAAQEQEQEAAATNCSASMSSNSGGGGGVIKVTPIEQRRLQSGRNRLGTPRHYSSSARQALDNCDRPPTTTQPPATDESNYSAPFALQQQQQQQQPATGTESELSVASNLNQLPPSYGTATQMAPVLGQLQLDAAQLEPQAIQWATLSTRQQQQRSKDDSYGFLKRATAGTSSNANEHQRCSAVTRAAATVELTNNEYAPVSHNNKSPAGSHSNGLTMRRAMTPSGGGGVYATPNAVVTQQQQQQQQQEQLINHRVIISPANGAQQQQRQQQWRCALPLPPHQVATSVGANQLCADLNNGNRLLLLVGSADQANQEPANRYAYVTTTPTQVSHANTGHELVGAPSRLHWRGQHHAGQQRDNNTMSKSATFSFRSQRELWNAHNTDYLSPPVAATLSQRRRQQQQQQQQPSCEQHRKRRRHRSTSGRLYACEQNNNARQNVVNNSEQIDAGTNRRARASHTISAHCWLIDSSDENQCQETTTTTTTTTPMQHCSSSADLRRLPANETLTCRKLVRSGGGGSEAHLNGRRQVARFCEQCDSGPCARRRLATTSKSGQAAAAAGKLVRLTTFLSYVSSLWAPSNQRHTQRNATIMSKRRTKTVPRADDTIDDDDDGDGDDMSNSSDELPATQRHLSSHYSAPRAPTSVAGSQAYSSSCTTTGTSAYFTGGTVSSSQLDGSCGSGGKQIVQLAPSTCRSSSGVPSSRQVYSLDGAAELWRAPPQQTSPFVSYNNNSHADSSRRETCGEQIELIDISVPGGGDATQDIRLVSPPLPPQVQVPADTHHLHEHALRPAHLVLSDSELISAASEQQQRSCVSAPTRSSRRRWWWNSLVMSISRRPSAACARGSNSSEGSSSPALMTTTAAAASSATIANDNLHAISRQRSITTHSRYRTLKSNATQDASQRRQVFSRTRCNANSTLKNVLSLARVDRAFRCRLCASVLVALVLLALMCLLAGLIYKRSLVVGGGGGASQYLFGNTHLQRARSNTRLFSNSNSNSIDGTTPNNNYYDYDLAWLLSVPPEEYSHAAIGDELKTMLALVDKSERLHALQLALTHLINIQLARDEYVDVVQLIALLISARQSNGAATEDNDDTKHLALNNNNLTTTIQRELKPSQLELELVSLVLLSNLHWPLVKWRHQSQQSLATNFFSFALPSSESSSSAFASTPSNSATITHTIRSLLSSLILVDTLAWSTHSNTQQQQQQQQVLWQHTNAMRQLHRVNTQLKQISYHLLECELHKSSTTPTMLADNREHRSSNELDDDMISVEVAQQATSLQMFRDKFCTKLTHRYLRLVSRLSQLNHNDLASSLLYDNEVQNYELPASVFSASNGNNPTPSTSKSLPAFLLDRLALLDTRLLAELTMIDDDNVQDEEEEADESNKLQALNVLLAYDDQLEIGSKPLADFIIQHSTDNSQQEQQQLFDVLRSLVGDAQSGSLFGGGGGDSMEQEEELQTKSMATDDDKGAEHDWRQLVQRDLVAPWPSVASQPRLPTFVRVHNNDLFLHPNLTTQLVHGMIKIDFSLWRATRFIVLRCAHLNLVEVSMWQRRERAASGPPKQQQQTDDGTSHYNQSTFGSDGTQLMKLVPIRRILNAPTDELLFIELHDTLEPHFDASSSTQHKSLNFNRDELTSITNNNKLAARQQPTRNEFVLSISFNKTSLTTSSSTSSQTSGGMIKNNNDQVLEFIQYADYFTTPTNAQASHQLNNDGAASLLQHFSDSGASLKTMLVSNLNKSAHFLFPCFDQPNNEQQDMLSADSTTFKARFQLNLVHELTQQVLFNTQRRERIPYNSDGSLQMTVFDSTPVDLSAQQLAFVVCDQQNIKSLSGRFAKWTQISELSRNNNNNKTSSNVDDTVVEQQASTNNYVRLQVWAHFEQLARAEFIAQLAPQLMWFYQAQLDLAYPLDKLDLFAIPTPSKSTTMSTGNQRRRRQASDDLNAKLGLIVVSESQLMLDVNVAEQALIERVARELARTLASQFFGQLVQVHDSTLLTMLTEYLANFALLNVHTDWHLDEQQQYTARGGAIQSVLNLGELSPAPPHSRAATTKQVAVLQMFLLSLFPSVELRTQLMRECMHEPRPLDLSKFWQLAAKLLLATDNSLQQPTTSSASHIMMWFDRRHHHVQLTQAGKQLASTASDDFQRSLETGSSSERVVFVRRQQQQQQLVAANGFVVNATTSKLATNSSKTYAYDRRGHNESPVRSLATTLSESSKAWHERVGVPLVTASCYRDTLRLRQERLVPIISINNTSSESVTDDTRDVWQVPLLFVSRLNPKVARFVWLAERELEFALGSPDSSADRGLITATSGRQDVTTTTKLLPAHYSWFKLNHNQTSLVRVNYDDRNWEALISLLAKSHYSNHALNPLDRANLLDDALVLMKYGHLSVNLAMNLTTYLELGERDYEPWRVVLRHLYELQTLMNQNPLWHRYVLKLLQPISVVIGWKDDGPHLMRKLRGQLFKVALAYGDERIVARAKHEFKLWSKSASQFLVPNLQELAYVAGVRYGDQYEWFHCWQKYQQLVSMGQQQQQVVQDNDDDDDYKLNTNALEIEKRQLLTALASTQNTWLLEQFLNYSLDTSKIQLHHMKHVVKTLGKNPVARLYMWRFVRLNWPELMEKYINQIVNSSSSYSELQILETMILESTKHFSTKLDYDEVRTFFETKHTKQQHEWPISIQTTIDESLSNIQANIYWRDQIEPKLSRWLSSNSGNS